MLSAMLMIYLGNTKFLKKKKDIFWLKFFYKFIHYYLQIGVQKVWIQKIDLDKI